MSGTEHERPADLLACNRQMAANFAADPKPAKLYTGRGVPDPGFGEEGTLYFDRDARIWYGPKEAGEWGNPYPAGMELVLGKVAETSGPGTGPLPEFEPGVERVSDRQPNTTATAAAPLRAGGSVEEKAEAGDAALGESQGGGTVEQPNPPPAAPGAVDPPATAGDTAAPAAPAGGAKARKTK